MRALTLPPHSTQFPSTLRGSPYNAIPKWRAAPMLTVWLFSLASIVSPASSEGPFQDLTADQALAAAKRDKKVVMIDFFTTWCGPCKKLDKTTWTDPEVQKWLTENTIALRLDAEVEAELAKTRRIESYPTMLFLNADGTELDRIVGYKTPVEFLSEAKDALAGKNGVARAKDKLAGHEKDPMVRDEYAKALAQAGRYEEALAEYMWCFDQGAKESPSYSGVRLSFLLSNISRLGKSYPPALKALEERRAAAEARIVGGAEAFDDAQEAIALNRELGTSQRTLELYDRLRATKPLAPGFKLAFSDELLELLVEARRYQDALDLFDKPEDYVTSQIRMSIYQRKLMNDQDEEMKKALEEAQQFMRYALLSKCSKMYEALLGASKPDVAAKVADELIEFAPTGQTYSILISSAVRAKADDVAKSLADRGLATLSGKEKKPVERAARRIPTPK
jgi:thiol-disulfide isomerase/thioredoxin